MYHTSLRDTPSKLLLGYDLRNHPDIQLVDYLKNVVKTELTCEDQRLTSQQLASQISDKIKNYNKIYYDKHHVTPSKYKEGDYVLIRSSITPGFSKKFQAKYKGPYLVSKVLNKNRYVITDIPGF